MRMKSMFCTVLIFCSLVGLGYAEEYSDILVEVQLETGGPTFTAHVLKAEDTGSTEGRNVFLIHGFAHSANFLKPLMATILNDPRYHNQVKRIFALDLPGHSQSTWPAGCWKYMALSMDDYVFISQEVLRNLTGPLGYGTIDIIGGHSMGGMVVQMMEQDLIDQGTSLFAEFGTEGVMLIAAAPPEQVFWKYAQSCFGDAWGGWLSPMFFDILPNLRIDLQLGFYVEAPYSEYIRLFFTNMSGEVVPGAPTSEELDQFKSKEPFIAGIQLAGMDNDVARPYIDGGIFAGYRLGTVSYEQDILLRVDEENALHTYLGGQTEGFTRGQVLGQYAVHDGLYSMPESVLGGLDYILE